MKKNQTLKLVIFDLDGVLNGEDWWCSNELQLMRDNGEDVGEKEYYCPWNVKLLNKITDSTGAKLVFSSSHRTDGDLDYNRKLIAEYGITGELIGQTPSLNFSIKEGEDRKSVPRGCEIKAWLESNKGKLGIGIGKYKTYVILDDDNDMLYWQRNNFIQTDPKTGLTRMDAENAIRILNSEKYPTDGDARFYRTLFSIVSMAFLLLLLTFFMK